MLNLVGPGETFGEIALLDDTAPRSATVVAVEKGETRAIHKLDFDALRERDREVPLPQEELSNLAGTSRRRSTACCGRHRRSERISGWRPVSAGSASAVSRGPRRQERTRPPSCENVDKQRNR